MCGIAGFWGPPDAALLAAMTGRIAHRGPDGEGFFEHPLASLGHRRLAIIDPEGGHQPVGTDDGLVQLTYNGEVYNFRELRAELEPLGHTFHTPATPRSCSTRTWSGAPTASPASTGCGRSPSSTCATTSVPPGWCSPATTSASSRCTTRVRPRAASCSRRRRRRCSPTRPRDGVGPAVALRLPAARAPRPPAADRVRRASAPSPPRRGRSSTPTVCTSRRTGRPALAPTPPPTRPSSAPASSGRSSAASWPTSPPARASRAGSTRRRSWGGAAACSPSTCPTPCRSATGSRRSRSCTTATRSTSASTWTRCSPRSTPSPRSRSRRRSVSCDELDQMVWHQDEPIVSTGPYAQWCVMRLAQPKVTVLLNGQGGDELLAGLRPLPVRVPARAAAPPAAAARSRREAWESRDVLEPLVKRRLADRRHALPIKPLAPPRALRRARAAEVPARRRTT